MKIMFVDDLEIIEVADQYLVKSEKSDRFCVVNQSGYELISMLRGKSNLPPNMSTKASDLVFTFLHEMEDAGFITIEEDE